MGSIVYLDGKFVAPEEARVSLFDFGYLYGDGVFETLRAYGPHIFRLDAHLERLFGACRFLLIDPGLERDALAALCRETLERSRSRDAYLRVTVSRGLGRSGIDPLACGPATLSIVARDHVPYPEECYREGIAATILAGRKIAHDALTPRIKSCNYQANLLARVELGQRGVREGFLLNRDGFVAEGTVSNVFVVRGGSLATPSLASGCLGGITRSVVLELAPARGIPIAETELTPYDLYDADECFVTNTLMELLPVIGVDGRPIGTGDPGAVTRDLHRAYLERVEAERGAA